MFIVTNVYSNKIAHMIYAEKEQLIIGASSQIAQYLPKFYTRIDSRNVDISYLKQKKWQNIFICFAEQRTYLANAESSHHRDMFYDVNYNFTKNLIKNIQETASSIIYFSTAELWNKCSGPINIDIPFCYHTNHYTESKRMITDELRNIKEYPNVKIVYPFNFNSIHRKGSYLFAKIFDSILHKKKIEIGDVNFYRDMIHPSILSEVCVNGLENSREKIVGLGKLIHVETFIKDMYKRMNLSYDKYVVSKFDKESIYRRNIFYASDRLDFDQNDVLNLTIKDIEKLLKEKNGCNR